MAVWDWAAKLARDLVAAAAADLQIAVISTVTMRC